VVIPILTGKGRFRSLLAGYVELIGRKLSPPLVIGFLYFVRHGLQLDLR
jgi:hypothetical protein